MLRDTTVRIVDFCARHGRAVVLAGLLLAVVSALYDARHFSITTDTDALIAQDVAWHQRQIEFFKTFPQAGILTVVKAPTPELATLATGELALRLAQNTELFRSVTRPDSGEFFERNGLLFQPLAEIEKSTAGLTQAGPLISTLARDTSLRGVMRALSLVTSGVPEQISLDQLAWPLTLAGNTLTDVLSDRPARFSWQELLQGRAPDTAQLRHFIEIEPVLDFAALEPGRKASDAIRRAAADLKLDEKYGAQVALTGRVPMNDDQFSVIQASALRDTLIALLGVLSSSGSRCARGGSSPPVFFSLIVGLAVDRRARPRAGRRRST